MQDEKLRGRFQFIPVNKNESWPDQTYFVLRSGRYALGIEIGYSKTGKAVKTADIDAAMKNELFHWKVVPREVKYVRFVNRGSGYTLDNDDSTSILYNMQDWSYMKCQEWEIVPIS